MSPGHLHPNQRKGAVEGPLGQDAPEPLATADLARAAAVVRSVKVRAVKPG